MRGFADAEDDASVDGEWSADRSQCEADARKPEVIYHSAEFPCEDCTAAGRSAAAWMLRVIPQQAEVAEAAGPGARSPDPLRSMFSRGTYASTVSHIFRVTFRL